MCMCLNVFKFMGVYECIDMCACIRVFYMYICMYVCPLITCTQFIFSVTYVCGKCAVPLQL